MVSFRLGQQIPGGAYEKEKPTRQDGAKQNSYHVPLSIRNPWLSEEAARFDTLAVWLVPFVGAFITVLDLAQ